MRKEEVYQEVLISNRGCMWIDLAFEHFDKTHPKSSDMVKYCFGDLR